MKFMRDRSLRQIGFTIMLLMFAIYFTEYFVIRYKINVLDEVEQKLDYTRSSQLASQQIALQVQRFLNGDKSITADIEARILQQDHLLDILGKGGRVDGTDLILRPLSRLPKISHDNLIRYWNDYKASVRVLITQSPDTTFQQIPAASTDMAVDSFTSVPVTPIQVSSKNPKYTEALLKQESLWIRISAWYDVLFADLEEEVSVKKASVNTWVISLIFLDILLLGALFYLFDRFVIKPIHKLRESTAAHRQEFDLPKDEIGALAWEINETLENLKDATDFVTAIGKGNLEMNYKETLDEGYVLGKNKLADSLIDMQQKLKTMNEEERKRQWANEGLTKFVEILRSSDNDIHLLGDKIISALVKYTHSNQGGLYILNDDDEYNKHLELISMFAFDIKKYEVQKVKLGQGVLGQTFLERETTYLKEIPEEYIKITSGLGDAAPKSILMVPLKVDREVYGIVELASFKLYEDHEIAFVERLGETIASTLASVRAAQKNKTLIEQFQQQTEEMRAQEEEMRQNMEELQATQEEVVRKEKAYQDRIETLEQEIGNATSSVEIETLKHQAAKLEADFQGKISSLEQALLKAKERGDDWQVAEDLERTLTIQLEALKITQDELNRKRHGA
ncbi:GAF domain-containing protein [Pseudochryseolinea flava]|nr:GAF domain-containing protein [Pseudochryseolinea flava]